MEIKKNYKMINKNNEIAPMLYEDDNVPYWVEKLIDTPVGKVRVIKTELDKVDKRGGYMVRWGINRDNYRVSPGLYAIGNPDSKCNVLITANYKFTVDKLRQELKGQNLWLVILDTKGINVWCAAGKGTFGTTEIIGRIRKVQLNRVVEHKKIILPQLGAPGVSAHVVTKMSGFSVIYGPIRASDIPEFLVNDIKAKNGMREVSFSLMDRLVLTPVEIVNSLKYIPIIYIAFFLLNVIKPGDMHIREIFLTALLYSIPYFAALFSGAFLLPVLLPYIPFKAFSLKGCVLGIVLSYFPILWGEYFRYPNSILIYGGNTLIITSIVAFIGLNFTGCTTYTSLSGVKIETKWTTIIAAIASLCGAILIIVNTL